MIEQQWLERMWNLEPLRSKEIRFSRDSAIAHPMNALTASREDVYAFTHALMFETDLGSRRVRLPRNKGAIVGDAEVALARCLDEQDYDLGGEVLLAWPLLRRFWSPGARFAFGVLARVEDEVGFLPAPLTRVDHYQLLHGEERTHYALATTYHTAYVMGLLCATALSSNNPPPAKVKATGIAFGAAKALLEFIDDDTRRPHWRDDLSALARNAQDALAPMLFTIAVTRAVSSRKLERVRSLLQVGAGYGLLASPTAYQAAGLLRRAALLKY